MSVFFYEPFYDFDRLIDEALPPRQGNGQELQRRRGEINGAIKAFRPRMDLHENHEKNIVTATFEFPGVPKENIEIDVHNGRLTVSADTKESTEHNEHGYAVRERRFGKFSRTLQLPQGVKDSEIKASMENGVLSVTFPKSGSELAPKKITIQ